MWAGDRNGKVISERPSQGVMSSPRRCVQLEKRARDRAPGTPAFTEEAKEKPVQRSEGVPPREMEGDQQWAPPPKPWVGVASRQMSP